MSDRLHVGAVFRAIRIELRLRQSDVATRAGVSQTTISRLERGVFGSLSIDVFLRIADALDAEVPLAPRLRGPRLVRLRDRRHAAIQNDVASELRSLGWTVLVEESFNHYGERGSVDILAWLPERAILLVVEIKTELVDLQDTLRTLDVKARVLPIVVRRSRGWHATHVAAVVVLPRTATQHKIVADHGALLDATLPARTREVRHWVADPAGALRGIWFVPNSHRTPTTDRACGTQRVRLSPEEAERVERSSERRNRSGSAAGGRRKSTTNGEREGSDGA